MLQVRRPFPILFESWVFLQKLEHNFFRGTEGATQEVFLENRKLLKGKRVVRTIELKAREVTVSSWVSVNFQK